MENITVIGFGANGMATAAYLTLKGYRVTLCDTVEQAAAEEDIHKKNGIVLRGALNEAENPIQLFCMTNSFSEAMRSAECVIVCVSVERHMEVLSRIAHLIKPDQTILFNPGNMASVVLLREYPELHEVAGVVFAELSGCLWACRITGPGEVTVALPLGTKRLSAYPTRMTDEACRRVSELFPVSPARNVVEAALNSPNVITHLSGTVFNTAQVEKMGDEFALFSHGISDSVLRTFRNLEHERNAVLQAAGLAVYEPSSEAFLRTLMDETIAPELERFRSLRGPSTLLHRYVTEDAMCGVALLVSLAHRMNVPVRLTESFLTIVSSINNKDYYKHGYTLANLGIKSHVATL